MHTKLILGGLAAVWLLGAIADHSSESSQALMDLLMVLGQPQRPVLLGHSTSRVSHPFAQSPGSSLAGGPVCSSLSHRAMPPHRCHLCSFWALPWNCQIRNPCRSAQQSVFLSSVRFKHHSGSEWLQGELSEFRLVIHSHGVFSRVLFSFKCPLK